MPNEHFIRGGGIEWGVKLRNVKGWWGCKEKQLEPMNVTEHNLLLVRRDISLLISKDCTKCSVTARGDCIACLHAFSAKINRGSE